MTVNYFLNFFSSHRSLHSIIIHAEVKNLVRKNLFLSVFYFIYRKFSYHSNITEARVLKRLFLPETLMYTVIEMTIIRFLFMSIESQKLNQRCLVLQQIEASHIENGFQINIKVELLIRFLKNYELLIPLSVEILGRIELSEK